LNPYPYYYNYYNNDCLCVNGQPVVDNCLYGSSATCIDGNCYCS
jgi:hypothetical protein